MDDEELDQSWLADYDGIRSRTAFFPQREFSKNSLLLSFPMRLPEGKEESLVFLWTTVTFG